LHLTCCCYFPNFRCLRFCTDSLKTNYWARKVCASFVCFPRRWSYQR